MAPSPKKKLIYSEAARLFQEKGYSAASMRDLAERVNLKASSLYSHIRKKEEILQKICFDNARRFLEGMQRIERDHTQPAEQLQALIHLHIDIARDDPTSITVFNDEWRHLEEPYFSEFIALRRDYEQRFLAILERGMQEGVFRSVNPSTALNTMLNALRWVHYRHSADQPERLRADISSLLLRGLENTKI